MNDDIAAPSILGNSISDSESLPQYVSRAWNFPLQQHVVDGETYYSVRDWLIGLTGVSHDKVGALWYKYRPKLTVAGNIHVKQLPYVAVNGATVQVAFTNDEGLYKIAMAIKATKTRVALKDIKAYLAKAGAFVDEARRDPEAAAEKLHTYRRARYVAGGKPQDWIETREQGVVTRKQFVDRIWQLVEHENTFGAVIGPITNDVYRGAFGTDMQGLRNRLGLKGKQNVRDHMSRMSLAYTAIAEEAIKIYLGRYTDEEHIPVPAIRTVVQTLADGVGLQVNRMAKALGIDLVTGLPQGEVPPSQGSFKNILERGA